MIGAVSIDLTEQKLQEEKLDYLAYHDALTGLPNRALIEEHLGRCLADAAGSRARVALAVINVNRFRFVNESLGHHAGDAVRGARVPIAGRMAGVPARRALHLGLLRRRSRWHRAANPISRARWTWCRAR